MMKTLKKIHDWNEVPEFESDAEASRFWDEHALAPELLAEGIRQAPAGLAAILAQKPKASGTRAKTIHFDVDTLAEAAKRAKLEGVTQEEYIRRVLAKALKSA
jgi:hypothetical protein